MTFRDVGRIAKFRQGDQHAFREIYNLHAPRVMTFLTRLTGDRAEAEDLLQEVFVAAYQGRDGFKGTTKMLGWLLGIAVRRWRDRRRRHSPEIADVGQDGVEAFADESASARVEDGVVASITLDEALGLLDPLYREALLLVAGQGLTYAEAAAITGEPIGTVKWRVSIATRKLRQQLLDQTAQEIESPTPHDIEKGGSPWRANA
jgi:RNA polymerase sigma-70 factor, ECF subfamily